MSMMRFTVILALLCGTVATADETQPATHVMRRSAKAMGTLISFVVRTEDEEKTERALARAFDEIKRIEVLMTDWERPGEPLSDVVRVNKSAGVDPVQVSPETIDVVEKSLWMSRSSDGVFDVTYAA